MITIFWTLVCFILNVCGHDDHDDHGGGEDHDYGGHVYGYLDDHGDCADDYAPFSFIFTHYEYA